MEQRFLSMPIGYCISIRQLKIDPVWDRIRSDSRFQQLLAGKELIGPNKCAKSFQFSYLKDNATRVRYARTFPFSIAISSFTTSAIRRSRSVPAAVSTALLPASAQDFVLVPTTSTTL